MLRPKKLVAEPNDCILGHRTDGAHLGVRLIREGGGGSGGGGGGGSVRSVSWGGGTICQADGVICAVR